MMESFFGSLKTEWVHGKDYQTKEQAKQDLFNTLRCFIIVSGDTCRWDISAPWSSNVSTR